MKAKDDTNIAGILEDLNLKILEYQTKALSSNSRQTLEEYLRANGIDVIDNEDGTLSATYNGINFIIDKTTYLTEVDNRPKFEVAVSEPDSNKKVTITVTISNASQYSTIDSIKLTNANNNVVVGEKTDGKSTATFEVDANGDYKAEVKATKGGTQSTGTKIAQVNNITVAFATTKGTIDIVWLKGTGKTVTSDPNEPNLYTGTKALKPVYWASSTEGEISGTATTDVVEIKSENAKYKAKNWHNYSANKWANATNTDGSYFVWIPRFAYRIIYWDNNYKNVVGYYDGRGMVNVKGEVIKKTIDGKEESMTLDPGVDTVTKDGIQYIVHPAFDNSVNNGGWSKKISGFWVAKYEMSREDYDANLETTDKWKPHGTANDGGGNNSIVANSIRAVSKPNVTSWRGIQIKNCYANSYGYDRAKESHLMKNSEWGAVAYLTHSKYGRNGTEVSVNQCTGYITGAGRGTGDGDIYNSTYDVDSTTGLPSANQQYNGSIGMLSSSTGNINGVYDLSGGAWEYTAAFNGASTHNNLTSNGWTALSSDKTSTPYATAYSNGTGTKSGVLIYKVGKVGDATKEVYNGSGANNWLGVYSNFVSSDTPFFQRGGFYGNGSNAGVFYSYGNGGGAYNYGSFRVVLGQ